MEGTGTTESRVRYLEQLSQQLNQQVKVMKQLVATEVDDLKGVMQQQIAEIKQIVMHQDRVYQERIRRLESRVEQLSEFAMQVARSSGTVGTSNILPLEMLAASPGGGDESSPRKIVAEEEDEDAIKGIPGVIAKYKDKIESIYDFYTKSNIQVFHPSMNLAHFTKLLKDCQLCGFDKGEPAELLWMTVLRKLNVAVGPHGGKSTTVSTGKFLKNKRGSFAFERLEEIPRELFGDALAILSQEKLGANRTDMPPEAVFETFLICDLLPHIESAMDMRQSQPGLQSREVLGAASVQEYKTDADIHERSSFCSSGSGESTNRIFPEKAHVPRATPRRRNSAASFQAMFIAI